MPAGPTTSARFSIVQDKLEVSYQLEDANPQHTVFIALNADGKLGSAVVPFATFFEGSTVFLPFQANKLYLVQMGTNTLKVFARDWRDWKWSERRAANKEIEVQIQASDCTIRLPLSRLGKKVEIVLYSKDFTQNKPWGRLVGTQDLSITPGEGDKYISRYLELDLAAKNAPVIKSRRRLGYDVGRPRIYQLFVRLFGNSNETRQPNGSLAINGVGKFNDINDAALVSLRTMGFSHIWLTGVLQQATGTDHTNLGEPLDDPDLLKGIAGSPYAIKDYFDVCPDYAVDPKTRLAEFKALLERIHRHQLKALVDFIPNHVARCYHSNIKPELNFGTHDDRNVFFDPRNNFFYLAPGADGPPLKLPTWENGVALSPTCKLPGMKCDGYFRGELNHGKVTGNNVVSWKPSLTDWYETVELNYGFDFTDPRRRRRAYPNAWHPDAPVPDTWTKMDEVIAYWQAMGADGFRCDMSHMQPPEFWKWLIGRARQRVPQVVFIGEAYDGDPAKVPGSDPVISKLHDGTSNVMFDLLDAGFDAVYDDPSYKALKNIYDGPGWANDLDYARSDDFIFENSVRYAENHDEVRLASHGNWGSLGMRVGPVVTAILFGIGRGAVMFYNGQEVGEPAAGAEGFGGDDGRTSIFDYWSMPELVKWTNWQKYDGGRLSSEQRSLRDSYARLLALTNEPAFRDGAFFALNPANNRNPHFGQVGPESAGGHWLYAFLRFDPVSRQRFLVAVNLHPSHALKENRVLLPSEAIDFLDFSPNDTTLRLAERLTGCADLLVTRESFSDQSSLALPTLDPLTAYFFEIRSARK